MARRRLIAAGTVRQRKTSLGEILRRRRGRANGDGCSIPTSERDKAGIASYIVRTSTGTHRVANPRCVQVNEQPFSGVQAGQRRYKRSVHDTLGTHALLRDAKNNGSKPGGNGTTPRWNAWKIGAPRAEKQTKRIYGAPENYDRFPITGVFRVVLV